MSPKLKAKLDEVIRLKAEIDLRTEYYEQLDLLAAELRAQGFRSAELSGHTIDLVDNFESKNTVFRPAGVKRFEFKLKKVK